MLLHTPSIAFRHLSWRSSYATAHSEHRFPAPFLEVILCYCTLRASLSGTFPGGHPMLLHTHNIAFRHLSWRSSYATAHSQHRFLAPFLEVILCYCTLHTSLSGTFPGGHPMLLHTPHIAFRHLSWRSSYATAHSTHRFPAPFLEVILCYCTLHTSLSGTFPGGHPMLLHTPHIAFRHLSWRSSYATAHSTHRFPAPFLEVILCYSTLHTSLSGTFPGGRLSCTRMLIALIYSSILCS